MMKSLLATAEIVSQEFVAIDRFSGGQYENKKFDLEAFERPCLEGRLRLHLRRQVNATLTGKDGVRSQLDLIPSAVGLLACVLKDLATGDIALGHGTRKGYGQVASVDFDGRDWHAMLLHLGEALVAQAESENDPDSTFKDFKGFDGEFALIMAMEALHKEAQDWAGSRLASTVQEVS